MLAAARRIGVVLAYPVSVLVLGRISSGEQLRASVFEFQIGAPDRAFRANRTRSPDQARAMFGWRALQVVLKQPVD